MTYFDNAATTPLAPQALETMTQVLTENFGNPSSTHAYGRAASKVLRESRQTIADLIGAQPSQIFFTSGATESNNTAIRGYALRHQDQGKHLITTAIEHHSVLEVMEYLEREHGFEVTYLQPLDGQITTQQLASALRPDTILVSIMFANNETGYALPIQEISHLLRDHPAALHIDAVQVMGKLPIDLNQLPIDFLSASAHKFHGPKGVGFLYARHGDWDKLLYGGDQEDKRRAGTENLPAIAGMAAALQEAVDQIESHLETVSTLRQQVLEGLQGESYINAPGLPYVLNIGFPGQANDLLLLRLDLAGIAVSTGSACTAGAPEPSHVLAAFYGANSPRLTESIRISFSAYNTPEEVDQLLSALNPIIGGNHGLSNEC